MARRSDHNREELYNLAMTAARKIVSREGFRGLTARKVAHEIGYSPGTLYNLFENLDEMAIHLNGNTLDMLREHLSQVSLKGDPVGDINALLEAYLEFIHRHDRSWNMLFEHSLPEETPVPDWYQEKVKQVLGFIEKALAPLFKDPGCEENSLAARVLWASLHGICQLANANKLDILSEETTRILARSLVENYVTGLKIRHGQPNT